MRFMAAKGQLRLGLGDRTQHGVYNIVLRLDAQTLLASRAFAFAIQHACADFQFHPAAGATDFKHSLWFLVTNEGRYASQLLR